MFFEQQPNLLKIPARFSSSTIDDIRDPHIKKEAISYCSNFNKFFKSGTGPAFFGVSGAGKTYAAAAIANYLSVVGDKTENVNHNVPVFWADATVELNRLMDLRDLRREGFFGFRDKLYRTPLLVLDDISSLRDFSRLTELFFTIINERYAWKRPTIFTGNYVMDKAWSPLTQQFGPHVTRRIRLMSDGLAFDLDITK